MPFWLAVQTPPSTNIVDVIFTGLANNPQLVTLGIALLVFYFATRGMKDELRESRKMLNNSQQAGDAQENKALDMATNAINKMDRVADAISDMAKAQRESSTNYVTSAQLNATAHMKTTEMLIDRIAAMDRERAEAEMYSNGRLLTQVNDQLVHGSEQIALIVGTALHDSATMHEETRRIVATNYELVLEALRATPPAPAPLPPGPEGIPEHSEEGADVKSS